MIYVKIEEGKIKLSLEATEFDSIVYTLDWDLPILIETLRPWRDLRVQNEVCFKKSVIDEFFEIRKFEKETPYEIYERFSPDLFKTIMSIADELEKYGIIKKVTDIPSYGLEYNCDILNMLEEVYTSKGSELIQGFFDLSYKEVDIIRGFYKGLTKERRIEFLLNNSNNVNFDNISDYLPAWCKDELKVFGLEEVKKNMTTLPEYKNTDTLIPNDLEGRRREMVEEIYNEFEIGSVLRGSEIRTKLREIYVKYGLNPKATIVNFMEYFVISKARSEYEWFYRIVKRRL